VVLALLASGARGGDGDAAKKELKRFEGTWKVLKLEEGGDPAPADEVQKTELIFAGDKITVKGPKGDEEARFTVDPSKKPAHIDIRPSKGQKLVQGIYKFEKDQLILCFTMAKDAMRPTTFASSQKPRTTLAVLQRAKK
jgi:uncharacterized protein (TIGR03067 family)